MNWRVAQASVRTPFPRARLPRWGIPALLLLIGALLASLALHPASNRAPDATELSGIHLGEAAPLFTLDDTHGHRVSLAQFRGRPVLLNFWSATCAPCTEEMPVLQQALDQLTRTARTGNILPPVILGIDATTESAATIQRFAHHLRVRYPLLLDPLMQVTLLTYHVADIPTSVVVDPRGRVSFVHVGALSEKEIRGSLAAVMG